jgi:hypothetical protein
VIIKVKGARFKVKRVHIKSPDKRLESGRFELLFPGSFISRYPGLKI